jgi:hypothetical protein
MHRPRAECNGERLGKAAPRTKGAARVASEAAAIVVKGPALVRLDLNSPEFQTQFFALERTMLSQVVEVLGRLRKLAWIDVYRSSGLKWEKIGWTAPNGEPLYSCASCRKCERSGFAKATTCGSSRCTLTMTRLTSRERRLSRCWRV